MFSQEVRNRLLALKTEHKNGVLPHELYLDMCRQLISEAEHKSIDSVQLPDFVVKEDPELKISIKKASVSEGDKRRYNRGLDLRRSYSKEEKLVAIVLKESGRSAEEVGHLCGIARSNIEKWTSEKTKLPLIELCIEMLHNGIFSPTRINFFSDEQVSRQKRLLDCLMSSHSSAVLALGTTAADLFMHVVGTLNVAKTHAQSHRGTKSRKRTIDSSVSNETLPMKQARIIEEHVQGETDVESSDFSLFDDLTDAQSESVTEFGSRSFDAIEEKRGLSEEEQQQLDEQTLLFWLGVDTN